MVFSFHIFLLCEYFFYICGMKRLFLFFIPVVMLSSCMTQQDYINLGVSGVLLGASTQVEELVDTLQVRKERRELEKSLSSQKTY